MTSGREQATDLAALSDLAPELAEMLVAVACDIALVLDDDGVIRKVALAGDEPVAGSAGAWIGQRWADTVTSDTQAKAKEFLRDLAETGVSRTRHLNHASSSGSEIPIAYTAVRLGEAGPTLAVGRDHRLVTAMQERLLQTQDEIERDYWRQRQVETRYRLLFQVAAEPQLILAADTHEVIDANRAAAALMDFPVERMIGQPVTASLGPADRAALRDLLDVAQASRRPVQGELQIRPKERVAVSVTPFQGESAPVLILRLHAPVAVAVPTEVADSVFAALMKNLPDGLLLANAHGVVVFANRAFRRMARCEIGEDLVGRRVSEWLGDDHDAITEIIASVHRKGALSSVSSSLRSADGKRIDVSMSATLIPGGEHIGFVVHAVAGQCAESPPIAVQADCNLH